MIFKRHQQLMKNYLVLLAVLGLRWPSHFFSQNLKAWLMRKTRAM